MRGSFTDFNQTKYQAVGGRPNAWRRRRDPLNGLAEDRLQPLEIDDALCRAHKLEMLDHMADGASHSVANLLQSVVSALNLIKTDIEPRDRRTFDYLLGYASSAVDGVAGLTRRLRDFSLPHCPDTRLVDLNATVAGMKDLLKCMALPGLQFEVELGVGPMSAVCDPRELVSTILDLVLNARQAMPNGGTISLVTARADLAVEQAGLPCGRYICICVGDTGAGMTADTLGRVLNALYTTKAGRRVGLGLPLAKRFVDRFHGHLSIESVVGQGTQVRLYLPAAQD